MQIKRLLQKSDSCQSFILVWRHNHMITWENNGHIQHCLNSLLKTSYAKYSVSKCRRERQQNHIYNFPAEYKHNAIDTDELISLVYET